MRWVRDQGLTLFFLAIFLGALAGQAIAGLHLYNDGSDRAREAARAGAGDDLLRPLPHLVALRPGDHGELAVGVPPVHPLHDRHRLARAEGLARSRRSPARRARETDEEQKVGAPRRPGLAALGRASAAGAPGSTRTRSLLVMTRDLAVELVRAVRRRAGASTTPTSSTTSSPMVSWLGYVDLEPTSGSPRCRTGSRSSWPSARSPRSPIYLRQRGSPESKPVGAAHTDTGVEG